MKPTALYATQKIIYMRYQCPHCQEVVSYFTESLPAKEQCHKCLKPLQFKVVYINESGA
jgi:hypothetical protein